jgi:hypothetical protein
MQPIAPRFSRLGRERANAHRRDFGTPRHFGLGTARSAIEGVPGVGQAPSAGRVTFQQAAALALPFPDGGFDVLVCQFGVMFFPNRSRASAKRTAF